MTTIFEHKGSIYVVDEIGDGSGHFVVKASWDEQRQNKRIEDLRFTKSNNIRNIRRAIQRGKYDNFIKPESLQEEAN
jgi:hypothetical protein